MATARLLPDGAHAMSVIGASCQVASPETWPAFASVIAGRLSGRAVPGRASKSGVGVGVMVGVGLGVGVCVGVEVGGGVGVMVEVGVAVTTGDGDTTGKIAWQAGRIETNARIISALPITVIFITGNFST